MPTDTVLVTGVTGFVGSHVALELLKEGYKIRATARSQRKADEWTAKYPQGKENIEWGIVPDLSVPGAFDGLMEGIDYVVHIATPVSVGFKDNEKDMLRPAMEGLMSVMKAAANQPSVKHVTITGSWGSIGGHKAGQPGEEGRVYTPDDWNETTWEEAVNGPTGSSFVYCASKSLSEKAAWKFMEEEKPNFTLTSLCAPIIYGPPAQVIASMDTLPASCYEMWAIFSGKQQDLSRTLYPWFVDVRDFALLHVESLKNPKARNQRYLACGGYESYSQIAYIAAGAYPEQAHRIAKSDNSGPPPHADLDSSKAERDFGITWTSLEKCITDMAGVMYAREKELRGKDA
ncbi:NAD(P)-binding protein [Calocera cornea HHB12733]|uniref:NAD(P)-binding protein n=1 Tax=Calocera cornea HHB12733 TaxID=1353952 RepID=A0A165IPI7_9BASI|nr:NAD(P)-binding protein [Calocera cornea HHB12733]